jgi:hypothetical protein
MIKVDLASDSTVTVAGKAFLVQEVLRKNQNLIYFNVVKL